MDQVGIIGAMFRSNRRYTLKTVIALFFLLLLTACNKPGPQNQEATQPLAPPAEPSLVAASPSPEPTATAIPVVAAATVNGQVIPLDYLQEELQRYQASLDPAGAAQTAEEQTKLVLNALIDQTLLVEAAHAAGFNLGDADLQLRIEELVAKLQAEGIDLGGWMQNNFYSDASFRYSLRRAAEAAWQRDKVIAIVPEDAEQVHVRQIFFEKNKETDARTVLALLNNGSDFDSLARRYHPETGGELGWFPHGYLKAYPQIEEIAFEMHPGTFSDLIESDIGYHILYLVERESNHPLTTEAKLILQANALEEWLTQARASAEILLP